MDSTFGQDSDQRVTMRYPARGPEGLVIRGYRAWLQYAIERDTSGLQETWKTLGNEMGPKTAHLAMRVLERLVHQLGDCSACALRFHCQGTKLCREECLILAMISRLQNGEEEAAFRSAIELVPQEKASDTLMIGGELAMAMKAAGKVLLPVSADSIRLLNPGSEAVPVPTLH